MGNVNNDEIIDDFSDSMFDGMEFGEEKKEEPKETKEQKENKELASKIESMSIRKPKDVKKVNGSMLQSNIDASKKKLNVKLLVGILCGVVAIASGATALYLNRTINADKHIQLAEATPDVSYLFNTETVSANEEPEVVEEITSETIIEDADYTLNFGDTTNMILTVNTKLDGDEQYKDYDAPIEVSYTDFKFGYDNVIEYIDEHNANSFNTVSVPSREDFYAAKLHADLALVEIKVHVPDDFPTRDKDKGTIGVQPEFSFTAYSTSTKTDKLMTNLYEFEIPEFQYIGDDITDFKLGESYTLRYVAILPYALDKQNYEFKLVFSNKLDQSGEITFNVESQTTGKEQEFNAEATDNEEETETVDTEETDKTDNTESK